MANRSGVRGGVGGLGGFGDGGGGGVGGNGGGSGGGDGGGVVPVGPVQVEEPKRLALARVARHADGRAARGSQAREREALESALQLHDHVRDALVDRQTGA
eukprot:4945780-Prymnesium_polylepis.1